MANWISEPKNHIDTLLDSDPNGGRYVAFETIKNIPKEKEGYGEWSFASKYCHFNRPEKYAIYDSRADRAVSWLQAVEKIHSNVISVQAKAAVTTSG